MTNLIDTSGRSFIYTALPSRVVFGFGTLGQAAAEVQKLGCSRALVLATPNQEAEAKALAGRLGALAAGVFAGAVMHTPTEITERGLAQAAEFRADCLVALGGGSTIGLGKAIALRTDLPQIAVPTTYAGSEATPIIGETAKGRKSTQRSLKVLPEVILYDVDLTLGLPVPLSVTSGLNAMAHAAEALYAEEANPVTSMLAEAGLAALANALPRIVANQRDRSARSDALYGAWACGTCLGSVGMALHHKLCHVLGGSFDLPHAETHAVMLPHALAYNEEAAPDAMARITHALGNSGTSAARSLFDLSARLGAPTSLKAIGMTEEGLARAAEIAVASPYWNPRPIERDAIRSLLQNAYDGVCP